MALAVETEGQPGGIAFEDGQMLVFLTAPNLARTRRWPPGVVVRDSRSKATISIPAAGAGRVSEVRWWSPPSVRTPLVDAVTLHRILMEQLEDAVEDPTYWLSEPIPEH
ncbi:hypothetical protein [Embleya sp. AB8]|uniref:hypothetical protein n=1 Tax=Embleya sp. AB8 TaxID=3156304 RepID=UPI003C772A79